jgi:hypothetical protein
MAVDSLATADDLASFPGAPFDELLVEVAQESVRADAGWHIAPVRSETLYLLSYGDYFISIPSLRILSVEAVRYGPDLTEYTDGWTVTRGGLWIATGWTAGPVEVDLTHGYDETPLDLLPVIAARADTIASATVDPSVESITEVSGPFTNTTRYSHGGTTGRTQQHPSIARYALPPGVA